jgi:hypothetical protein
LFLNKGQFQASLKDIDLKLDDVSSKTLQTEKKLADLTTKFEKYEKIMDELLEDNEKFKDNLFNKLVEFGMQLEIMGEMKNNMATKGFVDNVKGLLSLEIDAINSRLDDISLIPANQLISKY